MKNLLLFFVLSIVFTVGCKNSETKTGVTTKATTEAATKKMPIKKSTNLKGKAYTSNYICPMHCEGSGLEKPGKCPACNMALVLNKEYASPYVCPMHCKGSGGMEQCKCPVCKMDLVLNERMKSGGSKGNGHENNHEHDHEGHNH